MRLFVWAVVILLILNVLVGCASGAGPAAPDPMAEIEGYERWETLTDAPRDVSSFILTMCAMPSPEQMAFAESEHGQSRKVWDYVNEKGLTVIRQDGERTFPAGSIIVKEKFAIGDTDEPTALGIMIKREAGFNPDGGDWEFLYWDKDEGLMHDSDYDNHCQSCHEQASTTDFVFFPNAMSKQFGQ
jgi:hypothetical protein